MFLCAICALLAFVVGARLLAARREVPDRFLLSRPAVVATDLASGRVSSVCADVLVHILLVLLRRTTHGEDVPDTALCRRAGRRCRGNDF